MCEVRSRSSNCGRSVRQALCCLRAVLGVSFSWSEHPWAGWEDGDLPSQASARPPEPRAVSASGQNPNSRPRTASGTPAAPPGCPHQLFQVPRSPHPTMFPVVPSFCLSHSHSHIPYSAQPLGPLPTGAWAQGDGRGQRSGGLSGVSSPCSVTLTPDPAWCRQRHRRSEGAHHPGRGSLLFHTCLPVSTPSLSPEPLWAQPPHTHLPCPPSSRPTLGAGALLLHALSGRDGLIRGQCREVPGADSPRLCLEPSPLPTWAPPRRAAPTSGIT